MAKTVTKQTKGKPTRRRSKTDQSELLTEQLRELRMPTIREAFQETATRAAVENLSHVDYLSELTNLECEVRREGRIKRLMTRSKLPLGKSWESFDFDRLPLQVKRQLETLRDFSHLLARIGGPDPVSPLQCPAPKQGAIPAQQDALLLH